MSLPANWAMKTMAATCTVWVGATNTRGYGLIFLDGSAKLAHRVAYEAEYGPIPDGLVIDHKCRVRNCVTPSHLEPVTNRENTARGRAATRLTVGDECINGHAIHGPDDLYISPGGGKVECRACRRASNHRKGIHRPTVQRTARIVRADLALADAEVAS